jgi:hypothetical protein
MSDDYKFIESLAGILPFYYPLPRKIIPEPITSPPQDNTSTHSTPENLIALVSNKTS